MIKKYIVPSLVAAGLLPLNDAFALSPTIGLSEARTDSPVSIVRQFKLFHKYNLAAHRSHSSHASHASHRSSAGGSYVYTPRVRTPTYVPPVYSAPIYNPPAAPLYQEPPVYVPPQPLVPLQGRSNKFKGIVEQVQMALIAYGYYKGEVDGVVGVNMRVAIGVFQQDSKLKVTGTVTPELLDALKIIAE
jgi:His-Xaa-Ser repeat protein HxsA